MPATAAYRALGSRPRLQLLSARVCSARVGSSGILLEVERGKTTINNMDFLDFWKCHLCEHAHYLFLLVPQELRQRLAGLPDEGAVPGG